MENKNQDKYAIPVAIVIGSIIISGAWMYVSVMKDREQKSVVSERVENHDKNPNSILAEKVIPSGGLTLPVVWGDLGAKMVDFGVIDYKKFKQIYERSGKFSDEYEKMLKGTNNEKLKITRENSGFILNLFWALGLSSKNAILDTGEMSYKVYGGPQVFASTAGWTVSSGDVMNHYSRHSFFNLSAEQQFLVNKVSKNIYRPCCDNSTHFPDCNHGMAMLGLLELLASQGASEEQMYASALAVNSFWFPDNYMTIAKYMEGKGTSWNKVEPKTILGKNYSSISGFSKIASQVETTGSSSGGGCGIDSEPVRPTQSSGGGCGL